MYVGSLNVEVTHNGNTHSLVIQGRIHGLQESITRTQLEGLISHLRREVERWPVEQPAERTQ